MNKLVWILIALLALQDLSNFYLIKNQHHVDKRAENLLDKQQELLESCINKLPFEVSR